ncbi:hypothetical protein [Amycolatopsis sp. NPDC003861]
MTEGFRVDVQELHVLATRLHGSGDLLNDRRNGVPSEPADAGASSDVLAGALISLLNEVGTQLGELDQLITNLGHARDWYAEADRNARADVLRPFRLPDAMLPAYGPLSQEGPASR